jgi:two-component system, OmpR family, response regulator
MPMPIPMPLPAPDVILVEDDADLLDSMCHYLQKVGLQVRAVASAVALDREMARQAPDVIVLDINLPDENGYSIAERLSGPAAPRMVMLTGRGGLDDRVMGLTSGADVYLVKPVEMRELEAVIRSLHRRLAAERAGMAGSDGLAEPPPAGNYDEWQLDLSDWSLTLPGGTIAIKLTHAEFRLLSVLVESPGNSVGRDEIAMALGRQYRPEDQDRSIDALIARLRRKIEECGARMPIKTARTVGYVFAAPVRVVFSGVARE